VGVRGGKAWPHGGGQSVSGVGGEGDKHNVRRGRGCGGDGESWVVRSLTAWAAVEAEEGQHGTEEERR